MLPVNGSKRSSLIPIAIVNPLVTALDDGLSRFLAADCGFKVTTLLLGSKVLPASGPSLYPVLRCRVDYNLNGTLAC